MSSFRLRLELRRKNARLVNARKAASLTQKAMAEKLGISSCYYAGFESMRSYPTPAYAAKLAAFVGCPVETLFPPTLRELAKEKRSWEPIVREVNIHSTRLIGMARASTLLLPPAPPAPDAAFGRADESALLKRAVEALPARDADMVRKYYGLGGEAPMTYKAIGATHGLSLERTRQIVAQALEKIRKSLNRAVGGKAEIADFFTAGAS